MEMARVLRDRREEIRRIAAEHGATDVRVFGSASRGELGPDSDIDILVTLTPGSDILDVVAIKQDLEDLLGRAVDVVTEASLSPYIRDDVLAGAQAL